MTPAQIYTAVRDLVILVVIGFIAWRVYSDGENSVKAADMKAVQTQLKANSDQLAAWQKESTDANVQRATELAQVRTDIASHASQPVYVMRGPAGAGPVPSVAPATGCPAAAGGSANAGPGSNPGALVNVRPELEQFEQKYETALANCRDVLASWPTPEK
jgi:hypothetical protein